MVHEEIQGCDVGQHPMISRLLKGAFNYRSHLPRYSSTLDYLNLLGPNENISLDDLTRKTVMSLALTHPLRSADQSQLDFRARQYTPEGVVFIPTSRSLAKQSRQGRPIAEFFFPAFQITR